MKMHQIMVTWRGKKNVKTEEKKLKAQALQNDYGIIELSLLRIQFIIIYGVLQRKM